TGQAYDADGAWAQTGHSNPALLAHLIDSEPWFSLPPPKSTGRDLFNWTWLSQRLAQFQAQKLNDQDVQATLQMLTACTVARAVLEHAPNTTELIVCGGGAMNQGLMRDLQG